MPMRDHSHFEQNLREALHREAAQMSYRLEPRSVHDRLSSRAGLPRWLLPIGLPVGVALIVGIVVLNAFAGPRDPSGGSVVIPSGTTSGPTVVASTAQPTPQPTPHPAVRTDAASATSGGRLYLVGGRRGTAATTSVVSFDGLSWTDLPDLPEARVGAGAVTSERGALFVFGGETEGRVLDSTIVLDDGATRWRSADPMPQPQADMAVADHDGTAYLFGGTRPDADDVVQIFDLESETWTTGAPMPVPLSHAAAASIEDEVYLIGGRSPAGEASFATFRYDPAADVWERSADTALTGSGIAAAAVDGRIWVVGGRTDTRGGTAGRYPGVEAFDPATGTWSTTTVRLVPGTTWHAIFPVDADRLLVLSTGGAVGIHALTVETDR